MGNVSAGAARRRLDTWCDVRLGLECSNAQFLKMRVVFYMASAYARFRTIHSSRDIILRDFGAHGADSSQRAMRKSLRKGDLTRR
jgi:hypothetical protein